MVPAGHPSSPALPFCVEAPVRAHWPREPGQAGRRAPAPVDAFEGVPAARVGLVGPFAAVAMAAWACCQGALGELEELVEAPDAVSEVLFQALIEAAVQEVPAQLAFRDVFLSLPRHALAPP